MFKVFGCLCLFAFFLPFLAYGSEEEPLAREKQQSIKSKLDDFVKGDVMLMASSNNKQSILSGFEPEGLRSTLLMPLVDLHGKPVGV